MPTIRKWSSLRGGLMTSPSDQAWNNFVLNSDPAAYAKGSARWAAATANKFTNLVNGGGYNSALTGTWEIDPQDVVLALSLIGANVAAKDLGRILQGLGRSLSASSQDERWDLLERYWTEDLNELDFLSDEAETELTAVLEAHVSGEEDFYLGLTALKARQARH